MSLSSTRVPDRLQTGALLQSQIVHHGAIERLEVCGAARLRKDTPRSKSVHKTQDDMLDSQEVLLHSDERCSVQAGIEGF